MKQQSQLEYVRKLLLNYGSVSRNHLLEQFITRGGAIINKLKNEDFEIEGRYVKTKNGKDYIYTLISSPYKKVEYRVPDRDIIITKYEKI